MVGTFQVGGNVSGNVVVPAKIDPIYVRGYLKSHVTTADPDILAMHRAHLLTESRQKRLYAWIFLIVGILVGITVIGLAMTVVMVPMAIWGLSRIKHNEQVVDAAIAGFSPEVPAAT